MPNMLNKRSFLSMSAAIGVSSAFSLGAQATEILLPASAIQTDLASLKQVYTNLHPGLYRYATPSQIEARFRSVSQKFAQPASLARVYLEVSKLLASVRCGHSYANFYSQSDAVQNTLFAGTNRLPFRFVWLKKTMVVTDPAGLSGLIKGARISHINGISTAEILRSLLPYVRADGHNVGKQTSLLSVDSDEGFQTFDIFYALHFGTSTEFRLVGQQPDGTAFDVRVAAINLQARRMMTAPAPLSDQAPRWQLDIRNNKVSVLTMPTWGLYHTTWDWKAWLAAAFVRLSDAQSERLIIDIRGNEGGSDDCGPEILGYLTQNPLAPQAGERRVRYRKTPDALNPILETWDDRFRDWGNNVAQRRDGMFDLLDEKGRSGGNVTPKTPRFAGKVTVLTDPSNSSATLQFCQMLRENRLGRILGQTTGGNLRGINAEKFMFCRLPNIGIEVDVPLVGFFPNGTPSDSGLVPDIVVTPTWQDIASGFDRTLDMALK